MEARPAIPEKLQLECPQCDTRFTLKRYVPDKKVRCRKCRAIIKIPVVAEYLTDAQKREFVAVVGGGSIAPEMQVKVARIFSVPRLALMTLSMLLLLGAGIWVFAWRARQVSAPRAVEKPAVKHTIAWLQKNNRAFDFPIWQGYEWAYTLTDGGQEQRFVVAQSGGADDFGQFEMSIAHPASPRRMTVRVQDEGVFVPVEQRGPDRYVYEPPLPILKLPLAPGDIWTYQGKRTLEGGAAEPVDLEFRVSTEVVECGIGKKDCFRIVIAGMRGETKIDETQWYAPGVGLVKRCEVVDGKSEEGKLLRFKGP